ncbi:hypothetical protein [Acinetobacter sp. D009]|uniref:hypothetical protein n=1 Tax=Acinetobacter sp. D009 TaxID=3138069 RepID=UPI003144D47B
MMNLSNTYAAKIQAVGAEVQESAVDVMEAAVDVMEAAGAEAVGGQEYICRADEACDVASAVSEDEMYGGIQQEYVVKGCKVTIYNDGPVKMVNVKTDQPCDAPLPKDHKFSR